ncbi:ribbon-helix-helix domain-containing protein [Salinicoccus albus]|nr:ribbon-helix-helix domain-containing protein [Salinicoccus albus]
MAKNEASFIIRLTQKDLDAFNEIVEANAINRAELIRQWIKEYVDNNK